MNSEFGRSISLMPENDDYRTRFIDGFRVTENIVAGHLEQGLGIKFEQKPPWVEMDLRNRYRAWKEGLGLSILISGLRQGEDLHQVIKPWYNIIFTAPNCNPLILLRENARCYFNSKRRSDYCGWDYLTHTLRNIGCKEGIRFKFDLDAVATTLSFEEGLSYFMTQEAANRLQETYDQVETQNFIQAEVMRDFKPSEESVNGYRNRKMSKIEEALNTFIYLQKRDRRDWKSLLMARSALVAIKDAHRLAGYQFVGQAIRRLGQEGLEINEAIDDLIFRPPTYFDQLKDGIVHANMILRKKSEYQEFIKLMKSKKRK